jgi:serpin B
LLFLALVLIFERGNHDEVTTSFSAGNIIGVACLYATVNSAIMRHRISIVILTLFSAFNLKAQQLEMTSSLNSLSFDIYRQLKSDKQNLFFSPASIDIALFMAYEGAGSDTKTSFEKVLHIESGVKDNDILDFIKTIKKWKDSSNYLNISNAIWVQDNFKINPIFKSNIQTKFSAEAFSVDFLDKNRSALQINDWVSEKTNKRINQIISPSLLDDSTKLIITNAIYFIGNWAYKFDKALTKPDDFYTIENEKVRIDFMHKTEGLAYYENKDFQFISKNYQGYDKSFCVILPAERYGIAEIESNLNKSLLDLIFQNIINAQVNLSLPKLELETSYSLNEPLKNLGLNMAFSNYADFLGISSYPPLKISNVNHKAYIEVNEEKTEAAAVTAIEFEVSGSAGGPMPRPKIFKADHPFIFMIIDNKTKGIIFIGRFVTEN